MRKNLFTENGKFYKANLHCHSTWSDGYYTPEELKKLYKEKGYSVLAITDHEGLFSHFELDDKEFTTIVGMELEFNSAAAEWNDVITCHMCFYKKDPTEIYQPGYDAEYSHPKFRWLYNTELRRLISPRGEAFKKIYSVENINHVIKTMKENGFFVTVNHPKWSQESFDTLKRYKGMDALEIYNNSTYVSGFDEHNGDVYDLMLRQGNRIFCTANDDNHNSLEAKNSDMFGGFNMICAKSLDYGDIISAMESGSFYASTGPIIRELYTENGYLCVESETPLASIRMLSGNRYSSLVRDLSGKPVYSGKFKIDKACVYMRLELTDEKGKRTYTNAYFTESL